MYNPHYNKKSLQTTLRKRRDIDAEEEGLIYFYPY